MKTILVFKTSVTKKKEINELRPLLNELIGQNGYWNFDLEDRDNILRVETNILQAETVSSALNNNQFYCEELH